MFLKIFYLAIIVFIVLVPLVFDRKLKVEGKLSDYTRFDQIIRDHRRPRRHYRKWRGPKTDERLNRMLAESIDLLKGLGCPVSESICPYVVLTGSHACYGRCCVRDSRKKYNEYDFYIEISGHTLQNTEKSLRNTLIHELIHTVPGGLCHTGEWKRWARFVSEKTGYVIKRCEGDKTAEDRARLENGE